MNKSESMIFAPVIIPTLNRYEHLKRCIESLKNNFYAKYTDLYISVDYPPSEKYVKGYEKVKEYLSIPIDGFREVHCYYQSNNLGPTENFHFLINVVSERYDRYIFTEDDNEFSPNFLEYIDKGLELFKSESKVYSILGFKNTDFISNDCNYITVKFCPAYGQGRWVSKTEEIKKMAEHVLLDKKTYMNFPRMCRFFKHNQLYFYKYISSFLCDEKRRFITDNGDIRMVDFLNSIFLHLTDYVCIAPAISKVRNWGFDGTGVNMKEDYRKNADSVWIIDSEKTFEYSMIGPISFNEKNYRIGNNYTKQWSNLKSSIIAWMLYFVLFMSGGNREFAIALKKRIKRLLP